MGTQQTSDLIIERSQELAILFLETFQLFLEISPFIETFYNLAVLKRDAWEKFIYLG